MQPDAYSETGLDIDPVGHYYRAGKDSNLILYWILVNETPT